MFPKHLKHPLLQMVFASIQKEEFRINPLLHVRQFSYEVQVTQFSEH